MSEERRKKATAYKNRFNAENYDRINLTVPKGRKSAIEAHASKHGEKVNTYINRIIQADMGLTDAEWKEGAKDDG